MKPIKRRGKGNFKSMCEVIAGKDLPEVLFEGLADITKLPNTKNSVEMPLMFIRITDSPNDHYCVINGRYRDRDGGEAAAIAIGLWDEERNCFSVLKKTKNGKSLPLPFGVKNFKVPKRPGATDAVKVDYIFSYLCNKTQSLEEMLTKYKKIAQECQ